MHGDDVASAGMHIATEGVSLGAKGIAGSIELLFKLAKYIKEMKAIGEAKDIEIHGEQKLLSDLKKGGETACVKLTKEDMETFRKINDKKFGDDVPFFATTPDKNSDYVELHYSKSYNDTVTGIMNQIMDEKLSQPEQLYKMTMIDRDMAEAFQEHCVENNIPMNLLETKDGQIKCVFRSDNEMKIQKAVEQIGNLRNELSQTSIEVKKDDKGTLKFQITDTEQNKSISMKFSDKEKLERVLQEQFGYSKAKSALAATALSITLTDQQKQYFHSGTKLMEKIDTYERNIKFENDSVLTADFEFTKLKMKNNPEALVISDKDGNTAILPPNQTRARAEEILKNELHIQNPEQMRDMLAKIEKTGFVPPAAELKQGSYNITRTTQNLAEVSLEDKTVSIPLNNRKAAKEILMQNFEMKESKAEQIIDKARKQSLTGNMLHSAYKKQERDAVAQIPELQHGEITTKFVNFEQAEVSFNGKQTVMDFTHPEKAQYQLTSRLGIPQKEAQEVIQAANQHPKIQAYQTQQRIKGGFQRFSDKLTEKMPKIGTRKK